MEKPKDITYESKSVVGRIYRASKAAVTELQSSNGGNSTVDSASDPSLNLPNEGGLAPEDLPCTQTIDERLVIPGHECFMTDAKRVFKRYKAELVKVMHHFGVYNDAEVMSSHVFEFSRTKHKKHKHKDFQERLDQSITKLRSKYHATFFEDIGTQNGGKSGPPDALLELQKASAWYRVCYEADQQTIVILSFPWLVLPSMRKILGQQR